MGEVMTEYKDEFCIPGLLNTILEFLCHLHRFWTRHPWTIDSRGRTVYPLWWWALQCLSQITPAIALSAGWAFSGHACGLCWLRGVPWNLRSTQRVQFARCKSIHRWHAGCRKCQGLQPAWVNTEDRAAICDMEREQWIMNNYISMQFEARMKHSD